MEISDIKKQFELLNSGAKSELVDNIVKYLRQYTSQLDNYKWKSKFIGLNQFIEKKQFDKFNLLEDNFNKTIELKNILSDKLLYYYENEKPKFNELSLWIIRKWGRISKGDDKTLLDLIDKFVESKGKTDLKRISSKSKVLGFMYPKEFIIYDSRIAFAMNLVLLLSYSSPSIQKYFPVPDTLNTKLKAFDLYSLIRSKTIRKTTKFPRREAEKRYFCSDETAYIEMNKLVIAINKKLWDNERKNEPFYTQMLLFTIADTILLDEITKEFDNILKELKKTPKS